MTNGLDILGDDTGGGFNFGSLFSSIADTASNVVSQVQSQKAKEKSAVDSAAKMGAVIAADRAATIANATAMATAALADAAAPADKAALSSRAAADRAAADAATAMQDRVSAGLSPDQTTARIKAANDDVASAASAWQAATNQGNAALAKAAEFKHRAAQATAAKAAGGSLVPSKQSAIVPYSQPSFLSKRIGGVPVWGWGVGGGVLATGLALILRRR